MAILTVHVDIDLEELIPGFLANRQKDIAALRAAVASGDMAEITRLGHSLKGVGGGYGFDFITEMGKKIEDSGKAGELATAEALTNSLDEMLATAEIVFDE